MAGNEERVEGEAGKGRIECGKTLPKSRISDVLLLTSTMPASVLPGDQTAHPASKSGLQNRKKRKK